MNPTVIQETYHALVFGQKWVPGEARRRLGMVLRHPHIEFSNQTKRDCEVALALASNHGLGGRDSLILANFLTSKVPVMLTRDDELLSLKEIAWRDFRLKIKAPLR